ncbi:hypothetical protein [Thermococcus sp. JCM 11816]|uniref:hypothetical protein n=1 Tax=Thermococcus sp. (strain JCM 11816 / KS-1) TaxID=1295125 RepID=UPI0006D29BC2
MKNLVSFGLVLLFLVSLGAVPVFYENYAEALGILQKEPTPWARSYGGSGYDEANAVALAPNGDIIVTGFTYSFGAGYRDIWVLRLDENGSVKWQKTYGGSDWDEAYAVAVAPNGGYRCGGLH